MTLKVAVKNILKEIRNPGCPPRFECEDSFCVAYNTLRKYLKRV